MMSEVDSAHGVVRGAATCGGAHRVGAVRGPRVGRAAARGARGEQKGGVASACWHTHKFVCIRIRIHIYVYVYIYVYIYVYVYVYV